MTGQKERKGSRAAMAGRQNGKRKGKGKRKEVESNMVGPQFCTVFSAQESMERLRIPPSFNQYLEDETGLVFLLGQSLNPWITRLESDTQGLFFGDGWDDFVMDHSIEEGHILTFCYYRRSHFSVVIFDEMRTEKPSAFHANPTYDLVESDEEDKQISAAPQEESNGTKRKRAGDIDANISTLRKRSNGASVGYMSASLNNTEDSNSSNHVFEESSACNYSSKSLPMLSFSKDGDIRGKTNVEVQKPPEVMSQRPPVSEAQKNYALQRANQYKSKNPITLQIMKQNYVYNTFFMIIPCEFVREYLPHTDKKLTLWDPQGKAWEVTYVYCSQSCVGAFCGGWGNFSQGNNLEEFDACVFELFKENNIKVHIFRANPHITPYLLDSSNK